MSGAAARIAAIVLAAGDSSRMGPERNKLLESIDGRPLVAWPVDALLEAGIDPVVVATGFEAERVREALGGRPCRFVHHAGWAEGMGSTLARVVGALLEAAPAAIAESAGPTLPAPRTPPTLPGLDAVLVCVGDLPALRSAHVRAVVAAAREPDGGIAADRIVVPVHAGRSGHPVLFGAAHLPALARLRGDEGGRSILAANRGSVRRLELEDDAILRDVDTPAEMAEAVSGVRAGIGTTGRGSTR